MKLRTIGLMVIAMFISVEAGFSAPATKLRIDHSPVTLGARGQEVVFRAQVIPGSQPVKSVTLFYSVSRDAAPYKVAMLNSGSGWYTGSIHPDVTMTLTQILYYIEARDDGAATAETPWYTIAVKATGSSQKVVEATGSSWTKPALIAGGVLLAGGAVAALAAGGGGGGGGGSSSDTNTAGVAGTYGGSVTLCVQPPGGSSSCSAHPMTIQIDENNTVSSDTLYEGNHMEGKLSGVNFLLVTSVAETNGTGDIQYLGTVINKRIAGSIQGTLTTGTGTGTYSGNFSAVK